MRNRLARALALALALAPANAAAGGLLVPGAGPHAQARAGAFVARGDDPSTLLHNPAGFAKLEGTQVYLGANFVDYDLRFQRRGSYEQVNDVDDPPDYLGEPYPEVEDISDPSPGIGEFQALPFVAVSSDLEKKIPVHLGLGVFVPQAYAVREFPERVDVGTGDTAPGPQRYDLIRQDPKIVSPSLAVAYSPLPELDVGVRLSWGIATIDGKKASWAIRNYEEFEGRDGVFTLREAEDLFVPHFGLGALYRPTPWLEVGASYASAAEVEAQGSGSSVIGDAVFEDLMTVPIEDEFARCAPGGVEGALKGCIDASIPQNFTVGARWILRAPPGGERADVELDLRWEDWSSARNQSIVIDAKNNVTGAALNPTVSRHGFRDVLSVRLGGSYAIPAGENQVIVRAGAAYDTAAAPDSFTRVDIDGKERATLTTGLAFETGRFRFDVGGGVVLEPTIEAEDMELCKPPEGPTVDDPTCNDAGEFEPVKERNAPDPIQATQGPLNQVQSPFNAGRYESGYVLLSAGITARF